VLPVLAAAIFGVRLVAAQPGAAMPPQPFAEELPGVSLRVQTDPSATGCPGAHELAKAVRAQLRVHAERKTKITLTVNLARQGFEYLAHIEVEGSQRGERVLSAPGEDCSGLKDALVVTLALILDETAEPRVVSEPATAPPLPPQWPPATPAPHVERSLALGVGAAVTEALPRDLSTALRAEVEFSSGPWGTALGAFLAPKQRIRFEPGTADLRLWGGQARLCRFLWHDGTERPVTGLCTEGIVAKLTGQGHDFTSNQLQARPWVALGVSASVRSGLDVPVGWMIRAVATFPLQRDAFEVEGISGRTAYRMPIMSFGLEALLRLRIL